MLSRKRLSCAAVFFGLCASNVGAAPIEILVPAYFYPSFSGSAWQTLTQQALLGTPITAIMNPASGPGIGVNSDYVTAINQFRAAGGRVLGYVPTGYAGGAVSPGSSCQPAAGASYSASDVVSCARSYATNYRVDGVFLDEFNNNATAASLAFYRSIYTGIKGLGGIDPLWEVVGNPGASLPAVYFDPSSAATADRVVTLEQTGGAFTTIPASTSIDPAKQGYLVYDVQGGARASQLLATASQRGIGAIFVTSDVLPNPWDTLPSYFGSFSAEVRALNASQVPLPSSLLLAALGLLALLKRPRFKSA
jgi:Spherulation-specific family 4/PEP-CTERM motif